MVNNEQLNESIQLLDKKVEGFDTGRISDGYHTFDELYEHRIKLYLALVSLVSDNPDIDIVWSRKHDDGSSFKGWIIVMMTNKANQEQISYHIKEEWIKVLKLMQIQEVELAPKWDGHTSDDVLDRIGQWFYKY